MRDTLLTLARDLAADARMSRLGDFTSWRLILEHAVDGCEKRRAALRGLDEPFASRARALIASTDSGEVQREISAAVASSTAVTFGGNAEHRVGPTRAGGVGAHVHTVLPTAPTHEVSA